MSFLTLVWQQVLVKENRIQTICRFEGGWASAWIFLPKTRYMNNTLMTKPSYLISVSHNAKYDPLYPLGWLSFHLTVQSNIPIKNFPARNQCLCFSSLIFSWLLESQIFKKLHCCIYICCMSNDQGSMTVTLTSSWYLQVYKSSKSFMKSSLIFELNMINDFMFIMIFQIRYISVNI